MVVALFSMYFMMSCFFGSALYFTMYNMGSDSYYATVSNLLSAAQVITMFITPFIMKKVSKTRHYLRIICRKRHRIRMWSGDDVRTSAGGNHLW